MLAQTTAYDQYTILSQWRQDTAHCQVCVRVIALYARWQDDVSVGTTDVGEIDADDRVGSLGLLGLDFADDLQSGIHKVLGSTQPEGWDNQKKTAYQQHYANGLSQEFNWTADADIGFTTGFGAGFNWLFGRIGTPWWTFNPHQSEYLNLGSNIASGVSEYSTRERYIYVGSSVNVNIYNSFLQGQTLIRFLLTCVRGGLVSWR